MKAFFTKWWGKFKSSPMYVKAGIVGVLFFSIYWIFIRKNGEYDNVTSAEIQNGVTTSDYTTPTPTYTSTPNGSMTTDNTKALYDAQVALYQQENAQLQKQLASASNMTNTPSLSTYLNPVIANVAGNWLTDLINPGKSAAIKTSLSSSNTSSPVNTSSNNSYSFNYPKTSESKSYFDFNSSPTSNTDYSQWSSTNLIGSSTYTGFGSDSWAKTNYGW